MVRSSIFDTLPIVDILRSVLAPYCRPVLLIPYSLPDTALLFFGAWFEIRRSKAN